MSVAPEPGWLGSQISLFDHAVLLHQKDPGSPLPQAGEPFPDHRQHRERPHHADWKDPRSHGAGAARILDDYFARPSGVSADLVQAFHDVPVPCQPNDHIAAAARRADARRVQETGRWLVRHATDRCAVTIGLALLASVWDKDDIPVIRTIGLLSDHFGPLAARALEGRRGGAEALLWLADRVAGWGRVYVVEALCRMGATTVVRPWLLRRACDGDPLNGYFAGEVATAAHLHEAITAADPDDELIDHTGRLLAIMTMCEGMGLTLGDYPPAGLVLEAHAGHVHRLKPTLERYFKVAQLAGFLHQAGVEELALPSERQERTLRTYLSTLARPDWSELARTSLDAGDQGMLWLAETTGPQLGLAEPSASRAPRT